MCIRDRAYHVSLDSFEGPMDLLLHLISQARIEIREIFVSPIIDQYLDFMEQMPVEHMERTSEFVAMAARLLEIKSRWLLPKPAVQEEDPDQLENDLIRQLELYRQYKQASGLLRQKQQQAELVFYRLPEERYQEELSLIHIYFQYSKIWMDELTHEGGRVTMLTNTNKLIRNYDCLLYTSC